MIDYSVKDGKLYIIANLVIPLNHAEFHKAFDYIADCFICENGTVDELKKIYRTERQNFIKRQG